MCHCCIILWSKLSALLSQFSRLTKEAVNDAEETAHGADDGGDNLVAVADLLAAIQSLRAQLLVGLGQQRLQGGGHGEREDRDGRREEVERRRGEQVGGEEQGRLGRTTQPHGFTCGQRTGERRGREI